MRERVDERYAELRAIHRACQGASRGTYYSPRRIEKWPASQQAAVAWQESLERPRAFSDRVLRWRSFHLVLAVLRRWGQRDNREFVSAAWLAGAAGRTG